MLTGLPTLQVSQDLHVTVETRGAGSEVLADMGVCRLGRMFSHALQVRIRRAVNPLRIRKRLREIRLGETEEFFLVNFLSFPVVAH